MCNLNLNPTTCMAVRGVQYWSSSERITKLNELLNKIKKSTEMTEQDETEARCWFSHSWHEAYSLHTVWCPLQRAGFTHLVHFFKFKLSTLILPASMREFNDGHRMSLQYKFHKKGKKKKKKLKSKCSNFTEITMSKQQPCVPLKASLTSTECPAVWPESQIWV